MRLPTTLFRAFLVLLLMSTACSSALSTTTSPPPNTLSGPANGYPEPGSQGGGGYPPPTTMLAPTHLIPTPLPPQTDKAHLTGLLIQSASGDRPERPFANVRVYLGEVLYTTSGQLAMGNVDHQNAPQTITDSTGRFVFENVLPGLHILAIQLPPHAIVMLNHPETGADMVFELKAGQITDLGVLKYDIPLGGPAAP